MEKTKPLKYRLISKKRTQGIGGLAGERTLILCLNNGLHATVILNEAIEFISLNELPRNLADSIKFTLCDCREHREVSPTWLAELVDAYVSNKRSAVKPKRKATMGRR